MDIHKLVGLDIPGSVIPAAPGWFLLRVYRDEAGGISSWQYEIIAWVCRWVYLDYKASRVPHLEISMSVLTADGEEDEEHDCFRLSPTGVVTCPLDQSWDDVDDLLDSYRSGKRTLNSERMKGALKTAAPAVA